jgi:hypothetical protein
MKAHYRILGAAVPAVLLASLVAGGAGAADSVVVASGLDNPRGIDIGADGRILVAEAGSGEISRIVRGRAIAVVRGLPTAEVQEGEFSGPVNVASTGLGNVFALMGAGPPDGDPRFGTLRRVSGHRYMVADVEAYQAGDPDPQDQDGNPIESNPYGLAAVGFGRFVVTDAANNDVLLVGPRGVRRTLATIPLHTVSTSHLPPEMGLPPEMPAEAVPTTVAVGPDGAYYVGELTGFPFTPGASRIWRIERWANGAVCDDDTRDGCSLFADGFTSVTGLDFGRDGSMYVVEMAKSGLMALFLGGDPTGALIRVRHGHRHELAEGELTAPGDVAVARNGTVYVTNMSVMPEGQVVAIMP